MLFRRRLVISGPREVLLTSDQPVVKQFLNVRRIGPIGMSDKKDDVQMAQEQAMVEAGQIHGGVGEIYSVPTQTSPRRACRGGRRRASPGPRARDHAHPAGKRAGSHPPASRARQVSRPDVA